MCGGNGPRHCLDPLEQWFHSAAPAHSLRQRGLALTDLSGRGPSALPLLDGLHHVEDEPDSEISPKAIIVEVSARELNGTVTRYDGGGARRRGRASIRPCSTLPDAGRSAAKIPFSEHRSAACGLLVLPANDPAHTRLSALVHLAAMFCHGNRDPTLA